MKTGLTLGKFAPLHRGHQYVIETALQKVDRLYVIVYGCDELPHISLQQRIEWIKALYPQVEVIPAPDGPRETGYTDSIMAAQENYIFKILEGRKINCFFSSEPYGAHVSKALGAADCRVDVTRNNYPVSASLVRENSFKYKEFVDPIVYRDLIEKVVFLGAPSTGKSTITKAVARKLNTNWVDEYGRSYWEENQTDRRLTPEQLLFIAKTHNEIEDQAVLSANKYLFCDTNSLTTWHFAIDYHNDALAELEHLADNCKSRYQHVFLCADDIPFEDTWERSGAVKQKEFQDFIVSELCKRDIPYTELMGSVEERMDDVINRLG